MIEVTRDIEQGTPEWFALRLGIPTASEFSKVVAQPGPRGGTSSKELLGRTKYLRKLAGERITGEIETGWLGNGHTERGKEREGEARALYSMLRECTVEQVAFVRRGDYGCSPDGLIGDEGVLELKDAIGSVQVERLVGGVLPSEHRWQCIGALLVTGRPWVDYMSHCRGLPPLIVRVERDQVAEELAQLEGALAKFNDEVAALVRWLQAM